MLDPQTSPELLRLTSWVAMQGTAEVLEVILRDSQSPKTAHKAFFAATVAVQALPYICKTEASIAALSTAVSLACTVRKLIQPHTALYQGSNSGSRHPKSVAENLFVMKLMGSILMSITAIDRYMQMHRKILTAVHGYPPAEPHMAARLTKDEERSGPLQNSPDFAQLTLPIMRMHQVETVLFATLVPLCHWRVGTGAVVDVGQQLAMEWITKLCADLGGVEKDLMNGVSSTLKATLPTCLMTAARQGFNWGLYDKHFFNGRLVVGCCNLLCTNLAGASEAALKTKLCSGCRQARYCCTKCQRQAWIEGGHTLLCGRSVDEIFAGPTRSSRR